MRRLIYLGYYFKQLNWKLFSKFLGFASNKTGLSKGNLFLDCLFCSLKYNISILEYFQFHFYRKNKYEKLQWAGTGHMYEYQLIMNPKSKRSILEDKREFYKAYKKFFIHEVADLKALESDKTVVQRLLNNPSGKLIFKTANGQCGKNIQIKPVTDFTTDNLISFLKEHQFDLVEEYVLQHPELQALSPSGVNTVRIITQLKEDNSVEILGCRQRIAVDSYVDNMAAGNMAATIDELTGKINGPGVYSDITKTDEIIHPVTKIPILGFQVPFWKETMELAKNAALLYPQNRSVGWDIVITEEGPGLIEGNHDWCKLLWQLPVKRGLKPMIEEK